MSVRLRFGVNIASLRDQNWSSYYDLFDDKCRDGWCYELKLWRHGMKNLETVTYQHADRVECAARADMSQVQEFSMHDVRA